MGEFPQTRMGTRLADLSIPSVPTGRTPTWPPSLTRGPKAPTTAHAHFSSADKHGLFEHIGLRPASHISVMEKGTCMALLTSYHLLPLHRGRDTAPCAL